MPTVTMTIEEYLQLVEATNVKLRARPATAKETRKAKRRKAGKAAKGMGRAMREANAKLRNKNGKLKKGKTQADVARLAHKIRRRKYA